MHMHERRFATNALCGKIRVGGVECEHNVHCTRAMEIRREDCSRVGVLSKQVEFSALAVTWQLTAAECHRSCGRGRRRMPQQRAQYF
jgi:hypothetical protein